VRSKKSLVRHVVPIAAVTLFTMAVSIPAQGISGSQTVAAEAKSGRVVGIESLSPADQARQRAQAPLLDLLNRIHDLAPTAYDAQFAGAQVDAENRTLTVHWAGAVPAELARLRADLAEGTVLSIKPARFSQGQLMAATQRVMPHGQSTGIVELAVDGSGITVVAGDLPAVARGAKRATAAESTLLRRIAAVRSAGVPVTLAAARPGTAQPDATRHADTSPYWAGAVMNVGGHNCTSGFSMYASAIPSTRFTLTAAHCSSYSDGVQATNGAGARMGQSDFVGILYWTHSYDLGVVRLDAGKSNAPRIYVGEASSEGHINVSGYASAGIPAGGHYCVHGMTGVNCNLRSGGQQWVCSLGPRCVWTIAMNSWDGVNMTWCRGDSGGPIYYWTGGGTVIASGVVSWSNHELGNCSLTGGASVVATAVGLVNGLRVVTTSAP
jgi:hypothetical protein